MRSLLAAILAGFPVWADAAVLHLDPARSQVTLSGDVAGNILREQAPGSLTTTVGGTIDLELAAGAIRITGARLDPNVSGNWAPGIDGAAVSPADFGGEATSFIGRITGALRNLAVEAVSEAKPLSAGGQFDASSIIFFFPANAPSVMDFNAGFLGQGSRPLAGTGTNQTATAGTFVEENGVQTLTITVDAAFSFGLIVAGDTVLQLKGRLVASSAPPLPPGPEITAVELRDGRFIISAAGASSGARLQSSTDLKAWTEHPAETGSNGALRTFTVPVSGPFQFFRVLE